MSFFREAHGSGGVITRIRAEVAAQRGAVGAGRQAASGASGIWWPARAYSGPGSRGGAPTAQLIVHSGLAAAGVVRRTSSRIVKNDSTAPQATGTALARIAIRKPCRNTSGCDCALPVRPASGGIAATNSSDPARATALLTPLATPACRTSAVASTVAVSGATTADKPSANTTTAGSTTVRYGVCSPMRVISTIPTVRTTSPAVIGIRRPIFCASAPARADSSSNRSVAGTSDTPAAIGEYPATTCSVTTNKKNTTPIPPYTTNVTRLTAVNSLDANTSSGTIASGLPVRVRLRSVSTNPAPHARPSV